MKEYVQSLRRSMYTGIITAAHIAILGMVLLTMVSMKCMLYVVDSAVNSAISSSLATQNKHVMSKHTPREGAVLSFVSIYAPIPQSAYGKE